MLGNLNGWHAIIVLVIILLLFGAPKLPALARSLGQSMKIFRSEIKNPEAAKAESTESGSSATAASTASTTAKVDGTDAPSQS
jgi:sec-independent protein translocase protein TatA